VATRVANLGPLEEVIDVVEDGADFVAAVERALEAKPDPARERRRREILAEHSWDRRADQVLALLDAAWAKRKINVPA
jgi:glycosyltransferase involved in cell wall biosynthesis